MVSLYFGLPGAGKTTMLTKLALDEALRSPKRRRYKHIYGNLAFSGIPDYIQIKATDIGQYMLEDCLILIDEGTVQFSNRDYKTFSKALSDWFCTHRHYKADIAIACQSYNGVDKKIRDVCDKVYYLHKSILTGWAKTKVWRIPYSIIIPDKKDTGSTHLGEIVEGYCKPPFLLRLFTPSLYRKRYYPYFDSWERKELAALPDERISLQKEHNKIAYENLLLRIKDLPRYRVLSKIKYKKLEKNFKKALTD